MIAVTFALPTESANFTRLLKAQRGGTSEVRVAHTGVGEIASSRSIRDFLRTHSPALVVSSGFAGALTSELQVADLLLAQNFTSPEWLARSQEALGGRARVAMLATAPAITDAPAERADLTRRTGAIAVDMETEAIAEACRLASVPLISLRAISDTPTAPLPAPPEVLFDVKAQKTDLGTLASYIARHPGSLVRLALFARQIARARARLADALAALVQHQAITSAL
jgi:adenosylhomocysteine nucleosidase